MESLGLQQRHLANYVKFTINELIISLGGNEMDIYDILDNIIEEIEKEEK